MTEPHRMGGAPWWRERGRTHRSPRRHGRGQSLVEFALILPVFLLVLLMAIDFGRALYGWVVLQNSARIAANFAGLNPDGWRGAGNPTIQLEYEAQIENDLDTANCVAAGTPPAPVFTDGPDVPVAGGNPDTSFDVGDTVVVSMTCSFQPLTPIIGGILGNTVQLGASSEFRIRSGDLVGLANPTRIPPPPTPTPTPDPGATPTPTPTPCLVVPDLTQEGVSSETVAQARAEWASTGFTGSFTPANGLNTKIVLTQSVPPGSCVPATTSISVTHT